MNRATLAALAILLLSGCAPSREAQLRDRADLVERRLIAERDRVAALDSGADRAARLSYLNTLRTQLGLANLARGTAPRLLTEPQVQSAYDVLEEVYGAIEWNIPLGPADAKRPLPELFSGPQGLDFSTLKAAPPRGITPAQ